MAKITKITDSNTLEDNLLNDSSEVARVFGTNSIPPATLENFSADDVPVVPSGNLTSSEVQSAVEELQGDIDLIYAYQIDTASVSPHTVSFATFPGKTLVRVTFTGGTVNLPASPTASDLGRPITLKKVGTGVTTLSGNGNNIDGAASVDIISMYDTLTVVWNGTSWDII